MAATKLTTRRIEKIWGRRTLGLGFGDVPEENEPVGEIWFEGPGNTPSDLLIKYLFTSDKLSVQVHPDDTEARKRGHKRGKDECWLILDADPGAKIGVGLRDPCDATTLRAAALDGSIENLLEWKTVKQGDVFYLPAGTIHAIGAGITLLEVQQNIDLTYRLYDYGRPRELHLDEAIAVASRGPWVEPSACRYARAGRAIFAEGRKFVFECWEGGHAGRLKPIPGRPIWIVPLSGVGSLSGELLMPGSVWISEEPASLAYEGDLLMAYPGGEAEQTLFG